MVKQQRFDSNVQLSKLMFGQYFGFYYSILGAGTAVLTLPLCSYSYLIGVSAAVYGLCLGCWYLLVPVLLADLFGTERISSSYGLTRMFQSVGAISVPPLAGYMKDLSGGYEICFYCMGACMLLGSVPILVLTFLNIFPSDNNDDGEGDADADGDGDEEPT